MCNVLCRRILCSINTTDDDSLLVRGNRRGRRKGISAVVVLVNRIDVSKPVPLSLPFFSLSIIIIY